MDLVLLCKSLLLVEEFELLCIECWRNWFGRNQFNHGGGLLSDGDVVGWAKLFLGEFHAAGESHGSAVVLSSSPVKWCPPCSGMLKLNIDATVRSSSGFVGFGMVMCDSNGWMLGSSAQFYRADLSAVLAEFTTLLHSLQFMATTRWTVGVAESDCLVLGALNYFGERVQWFDGRQTHSRGVEFVLKVNVSNCVTTIELVHGVLNSFLKVTVELFH
ncbi:hypothetical protein ACOSP7_031921 [Xanthoceras sorbifolium]